MQPYWMAEGRRLAALLGVDIIVFEYVKRARMRVHGVARQVAQNQWATATVEDFEFYARNFEIVHSAVVSAE